MRAWHSGATLVAGAMGFEMLGSAIFIYALLTCLGSQYESLSIAVREMD